MLWKSTNMISSRKFVASDLWQSVRSRVESESIFKKLVIGLNDAQYNFLIFLCATRSCVFSDIFRKFCNRSGQEWSYGKLLYTAEFVLKQSFQWCIKHENVWVRTKLDCSLWSPPLRHKGYEFFFNIDHKRSSQNCNMVFMGILCVILSIFLSKKI